MENNNETIRAGVELLAGRKVLYFQKGEKFYQLDSLYDEKPILNKWFSQMENCNYRSRYMLFGLGNGMYLRKLLEEIGEEAKILIWEPSECIFAKAKEEFDVENMLKDERVHIVVGKDKSREFRDYLTTFVDYDDLYGCVERHYLNYPVLFPREYEHFQELKQLYVNQLQANETLMNRMGSDYFHNTFCNYPFFMKGKSIIDLNMKFPKDIPAILVAAGPSLDKNVEKLKKAKGKSFIIAVDSAARALLQYEIIPDIIVSIDALKWCRHFEDSRIQQVPLICNIHCNRGLMELHTGDKYFIQDGNTHIKRIFESFNKMVVEIQSGGSVATEAYALLERLQFETVILVGLDLAYTDKKTHSASTLRGELGLNIVDEDTLLVEDIFGGETATSYEFQIYLDWFEEEIRLNPQYYVIDATEGGARIRGTIVKTLDEAILEKCTKDVKVKEILDSVVTRLTEEEQKVFREEMEKIPITLIEIKKMVKKMIRDYEKMIELTKINKYNSSQMKRLFEKNSKIAEEIEKMPEYYYIWSYTHKKIDDEFNYDLYASELDEKQELITSLEQAKRYYELLESEMAEAIHYAKGWMIETWDDRKRREDMVRMVGNTAEMKKLFLLDEGI